MREILFRGKRVDNGEWVYGGLITYNLLQKQRCLIISFYAKLVNFKIEAKQMSEFVIPETIGQFTGLTDKNGTKIFEGDIVLDGWNQYTPVFQNGIYMAYNPKHLAPNLPSTQFNVIWKNGCEVIGNIHEKGK